MILTPTSTSTSIAGAGYWAILWSLVFKSNEIPGIKRIFPQEKFLNWISTHKLLALLITEVVNLSTHTGIMGVTFALGGTCVNTFVIMIVFPLRSLLRKRKPIVLTV
jgi:hypothetical protein